MAAPKKTSAARRTARLAAFFTTALLSASPAPCHAAQDPVTIGSKKFTESVILGEIATLLIKQSGVPAVHHRELGGTRVLFDALAQGEIDAYPEYSGTISEEILKSLALRDSTAIVEALAARGIRETAPLGFNNTYALGMRADGAARLGINTLSDLRLHPELRVALTNEFLSRGDGWPGLKQRYALPFNNVPGLDHDVAYRALANGEIDVTDFYTTDAEIDAYGFKVLADDKKYFPEYDALFLYRSSLADRAPQAVQALKRLEGKIDEQTIRRMNAEVQLGGHSESAVAAEFLNSTFGLRVKVSDPTRAARIWQRTREHLFLVGVSLAAGILVAVPLGVAAYRLPRTSQAILGVTGVIQTIPALALLVFMIPLLGIYAPPAIAALFLYSLLPIVRNTHAGLRAIPSSIAESAEALGLSTAVRLWRIDLPLASPAILAGIKTSAVITIGFATLGALIGAGGYGQPILTGIRLNNYGLILEGAIPAAVLALGVQWLFEWGERFVVPRGLRLKRAG